jgi:photosystem II stability/assembly factor-like uncharacterized protein
MAYSVDGKTWTALADSTFDIGAITYGSVAGQEKFVAGGGYGKMATSTDGVTWTPVTDSKLTSGICAIAYGNGTFVAGEYSGNMATSSDNGATWVAVSPRPFLALNSIRAIAYGDGTFIAVSDFGNIIMYSSDNGTTWTEGDLSSIGNIMSNYSIAYGSNKFVVVGGYKIAYSTDGVTWMPVTTTAFDYQDKWGNPKEGNPRAIAYGNGKFVAGGDNKIATSTDGTNWTVVGDKIFGTNEFGDAYSISDTIAYGSGTVIVVNFYGDKIAYSTGL